MIILRKRSLKPATLEGETPRLRAMLEGFAPNRCLEKRMRTITITFLLALSLLTNADEAYRLVFRNSKDKAVKLYTETRVDLTYDPQKGVWKVKPNEWIKCELVLKGNRVIGKVTTESHTIGFSGQRAEGWISGSVIETGAVGNAASVYGDFQLGKALHSADRPIFLPLSESVAYLRSVVRFGGRFERQSALNSLALLEGDGTACLPELIRILGSRETKSYKEAIECVKAIGPEAGPIAPILIKRIMTADAMDSGCGLALAKIGDPAIASLVKAMGQEPVESATSAFVEMGKAAVPHLLKLVGSKHRSMALRALLGSST